MLEGSCLVGIVSFSVRVFFYLDVSGFLLRGFGLQGALFGATGTGWSALGLLGLLRQTTAANAFQGHFWGRAYGQKHRRLAWYIRRAEHIATF